MNDDEKWTWRQCTFTSSPQSPNVIEGFADSTGLADSIHSELNRVGDPLSRPRSKVPRTAIFDEGGERSYKVLGRTALAGVLPPPEEMYERVRAAAAAALSLPVLLSTHHESSVTAKLYGPGDSQGWHLDTNPVTGLLLLRVSPHVSPIIWEDVDGRIRCLACSSGDLVVFEGKRIRHCVPWHGPGDATVMILFNMYLPDDNSRPEEMDQFSLLGQADSHHSAGATMGVPASTTGS
jgi:hypothetical protein